VNGYSTGWYYVGPTTRLSLDNAITGAAGANDSDCADDGNGGCLEIVVVASRTTSLPNVLPITLWNHFLGGSGDTVCLNRSQFNTLASAGKRVGNLAPRAGGGYAQQTSYYGGDYANSFGTATLYLDDDFKATGFHDFYNFDAHGRTSVSAQAKTAVGALGYLAGGENFSVDYNNGDCR
jgi:hypothetical protein